MAVEPIPAGYHTLTPYLVSEEGDELIDFLGTVFGARVIHRADGPDGKLMHADLLLGDSHLMVGGARPPEQPALTAMLYVYLPAVDAVYQRALDHGATSLREPRDEFYGDRVAGLADRWGNQWWLAMHVEDVDPEELERRQKDLAAG